MRTSKFPATDMLKELIDQGLIKPSTPYSEPSLQTLEYVPSITSYNTPEIAIRAPRL